MARAATGAATRHLQVAREETLRQRLIARDERALVELIDHATPWLLGVAESILHDAADAEEVVMETFRQVWDKSATLDDTGFRSERSRVGVAHGRSQAARFAVLRSGVGPMNTHEWFFENRTAFVTRTLDAGESRTFEEHLARCPECQASVRVLDAELSWLPMAVQPVRPRPGFRREIAQSVFNERSFYSVGSLEPRTYSRPSFQSPALRVIRIGSDSANASTAWSDATVDPLADYQRVWRDAPRAIVALGFRQDTDQTRATAVADIRTLTWRTPHATP